MEFWVGICDFLLVMYVMCRNNGHTVLISLKDRQTDRNCASYIGMTIVPCLDLLYFVCIICRFCLSVCSYLLLFGYLSKSHRTELWQRETAGVPCQELRPFPARGEHNDHERVLWVSLNWHFRTPFFKNTHSDSNTLDHTGTQTSGWPKGVRPGALALC